jgi:hypothetical protein
MGNANQLASIAVAGLDETALDQFSKLQGGCVLDRINVKRCTASAQFDLMSLPERLRKLRRLHQCLGNHQLAVQLLGRRFQPARGVHRVADRGQGVDGAEAHLAHDRRAVMDADADPKRRLQFLAEAGIHLGEIERHALGRVERLGGGIARLAVDSEQRHHAIADELVEMTTGRDHRLAHGAEVAIEQEHHVVRETLLGKLREAADVGEQHRDLALLAGMKVVARLGLFRRGTRRQQRHHLHIALRLCLAGQARAGRRTNPRQYAQLLDARRRQGCIAGEDANPAGRAAPAPAADRGMRDVADAARLQNRAAGLDADDAPVRIGDANGAVPDRPVADVAAGQHADHDRRINDQRDLEPEIELRAGFVPRQVATDRHRMKPTGLFGQHQHLARRLREAEQSEHRNEQRRGIECAPRLRIPRFQPQPEGDADAAMNPGDQHRRRLHRDQGRTGSECQHRLLISIVETEGVVRDRRAEEVQGEQRRDRKAEDQLRAFRDRHPEAVPVVERAHAEREMRDQREQEQDLDRRKAPEGEERDPPPIHCCQRHQAQRMVEAVGQHIEKEKQAGREPQAS